MKTPETKQLHIIVKNLVSGKYNPFGKQFVSMLKSFEGVQKANESYDGSSQILSVEFQGVGINIQYIDNQIWSEIPKMTGWKSDSSGFALDSIGNDEAVYSFNQSSMEREGRMIVYLRRVGGEDYKYLSTAFRDLLISIVGVSNVTYDYDYGGQTAIFQLKYVGSLFELDDAIGQHTSKDKAFNEIARGPSRANLLIYYNKPSQSSKDKMMVLDPEAPELQQKSANRNSDNSSASSSSSEVKSDVNEVRYTDNTAKRHESTEDKSRTYKFSGNSYPDYVIANYMNACVGSRGYSITFERAKTYCECTIRKFQQRYTLAQFNAMETYYYVTGVFPGAAVDICNECK